MPGRVDFDADFYTRTPETDDELLYFLTLISNIIFRISVQHG
jgi:hypothetical protein